MITEQTAKQAEQSARAAYSDLTSVAPNPRDFARYSDSDWLTPFTRVSKAYARLARRADRERQTAIHLARCAAARDGDSCIHGDVLQYIPEL